MYRAVVRVEVEVPDAVVERHMKGTCGDNLTFKLDGCGHAAEIALAKMQRRISAGPDGIRVMGSKPDEAVHTED